MKRIIKIMILSILIISPNWALASNSNLTHKHTNTPIELEFVSPNSLHEFKLAGICFLGQGDCVGGDFGKVDEDMSIPSPLTPEEQCRDEGFNITTCALPSYVGEACPYNEGYYKNCVEDKVRACNDSGFGSVTCGLGEIEDTVCPYDVSYKTCKCNPCDGYNYTYAQATAQGYMSDGSCQSCSTTKYKRKDNPCSGYQTCECGGEIGTSTCYSGSTQKFSKCKSCVPPKATCEIGWIYYSDSTCSLDLVSGKVPLGVVIYVTDAGLHGQVMTPKSIGDYPWGGGYFQALMNHDSPNTLWMDTHSCANTHMMLKDGIVSLYTAASVANDYAPINANETRGRWCLPAAGVLSRMSSHIPLIDMGIGKLGGTQFASNYERMWSSSEGKPPNGACAIYVDDNMIGFNNYYNKMDDYSVRPVMEF